MSQTLNAKIKQKELVDKSAIAGFINNADLNKKIATLAIKAELKPEQDKSHFEDDDTQNYLVFQPIYRYFKDIGNTDPISIWKSKGLSDERIKSPAKSSNSLAPTLRLKLRVKFDGSCLK